MSDIALSQGFVDLFAGVLALLRDVDRFRSVGIGSGESILANRTVIRRSAEGCIYVHEWLRSDPDDLHDHPWDFVSIVLRVGYWEQMESERLWRPPGSMVLRKAQERHRVEIDRAGPRPLSMIVTGPEIREWGFQTASGFIIGRDYRAGVRAA